MSVLKDEIGILDENKLNYFDNFFVIYKNIEEV